MISLYRNVNGLEFRTPSVSNNTVSNSSYVKCALPRVFRKHRFVNLTIDSKKPPHQLAVGILNDQTIPRLFTNVQTFLSKKVLPLSDTILDGKPLRPIKRVKARINEFACKSGTNSRCKARVLAHVNKAI